MLNEHINDKEEEKIIMNKKQLNGGIMKISRMILIALVALCIIAVGCSKEKKSTTDPGGNPWDNLMNAEYIIYLGSGYGDVLVLYQGNAAPLTTIKINTADFAIQWEYYDGDYYGIVQGYYFINPGEEVIITLGTAIFNIVPPYIPVINSHAPVLGQDYNFSWALHRSADMQIVFLDYIDDEDDYYYEWQLPNNARSHLITRNYLPLNTYWGVIDITNIAIQNSGNTFIIGVEFDDIEYGNGFDGLDGNRIDSRIHQKRVLEALKKMER